MHMSHVYYCLFCVLHYIRDNAIIYEVVHYFITGSPVHRFDVGRVGTAYIGAEINQPVCLINHSF